MPKYTFTLKKDDISLEYVTTDPESMARQFQIWVTCASVYTYNKDKAQKGLPQEALPKAEPIKPATVEPLYTSTSQSSVNINKTNDEIIKEAAEKRSIDVESERILQEYREEMLQEQKKQETEAVKKEFRDEINTSYQKEEAVQEELKELYKPKTINSIQQNPMEETYNETQNFDAILENKMTADIVEPQIKKDERFLKVLKAKIINDKMDYLIITAYYLLEFEQLDRFTLKQVNSKLMENISEVIDHSLLQQAIDRKFVEPLPNLTNVSSASEYRLTEAGEDAFLNGTKA